MPRVFAYCPKSGVVACTHAAFTKTGFLRLRGSLTFWCSACRSAHEVARAGLWLEGEPAPDRARWLDPPPEADRSSG
jgi:hypothetical protein